MNTALTAAPEADDRSVLDRTLHVYAATFVHGDAAATARCATCRFMRATADGMLFVASAKEMERRKPAGKYPVLTRFRLATV
jgi:hypothetical protein